MYDNGSFVKDYLKPKLNSSNVCSFAISLAAIRRGLNVKWYGEEEFKRRGIKFGRSTSLGNLFQISSSENSIDFNKTRTLDVSPKTIKLCNNKQAFRNLLRKLNLPFIVGESFAFSQTKEALAYYSKIGGPVVVKPTQGSMGRGITTNITSVNDIKVALNEVGGNFIVEKHIYGEEYRAYILSGEVCALVRRVPATVEADGKKSCRELLKEFNKRKRAKGLPQILNEQLVLKALRAQNLDFDTVPRKETRVLLSEKLGRSSGSFVEMLEPSQYPKDIVDVVTVLSKGLSELSFYAIDFIVDDNSKEIYILEANTRPQISSVLRPDIGKPKDIPALIVESLFSSIDRVDDTLYFSPQKTVQQLRDANDSVVINTCHNLERFMKPLDSYERCIMNISVSLPKAENRQIDPLYFKLGNIHQLLLKRSAWMRNLSVHECVTVSGSPRWYITSETKSVRFRQHMPSFTSVAVRNATNDKASTKKHLSKHGIRVPQGIVIKPNEIEKATNWFSSLESTRCVVKPIDGSGGKGVTSNIRSQIELVNALERSKGKKVVVEEHIAGEDYRFLIVDGKFVAAVHRQPAHVVGDGDSNILQLIKKKNANKRQNPYMFKSLIKLDSDMEARLAAKGFDKNSVPSKGEVVQLNDIANVSAGGDSVAISDHIHPDFIELAEKSAKSYDKLLFCGIDILAKDITKPSGEQQFAVIEVNANCDIAMHHFPSQGLPTDAAGAILDAIFGNAKLQKQKQQHLILFGKVQGVGFRKYAERECFRVGVYCEPANLDDGSLAVFLKGQQKAVDCVIQKLLVGPRGAVVTHADIKELEA